MLRRSSSGYAGQICGASQAEFFRLAAAKRYGEAGSLRQPAFALKSEGVVRSAIHSRGNLLRPRGYTFLRPPKRATRRREVKSHGIFWRRRIKSVTPQPCHSRESGNPDDQKDWIPGSTRNGWPGNDGGLFPGIMQQRRKHPVLEVVRLGRIRQWRRN